MSNDRGRGCDAAERGCARASSATAGVRHVTDAQFIIMSFFLYTEAFVINLVQFKKHHVFTNACNLEKIKHFTQTWPPTC